MALSRKFLSGMGLTAEQVDAIIEEHATTVESLKEQRDSYKEDAEKLKDVTKERDDLKKQLDDGTGTADEWKEKYEKEHKDFEDYKKAEQGKAELQTKKDVYAKLLKENGVGEKHISSILEVTKFDDMKLDKDNNLVDADKYTEAIKERWGGFISTTETGGADVSNPPKGGATKYESKADIMKIKDTAERQEAIRTNPELFGAK